MARTAQRQGSPATGPTAILRVPGVAMIAVALLTICVIPLGWTVPGLQVLFLAPIGAAAWIIRVRTTATSSGLTARTLFGKRELPWSSLAGLRVDKRGKVHAVTTDGPEVTLPTARARHLPVLALVSDGKLTDPTGVTDDMVPASDAGGEPAQAGADE